MGLCFRLLDAVIPGRKAPRRGRARTHNQKSFRHSFARLGWAALAFLVLGAGLAQATTYVYDGNGRLRAATNSTGASAEYVYDAMGNLQQVESVPAGKLAIFAFTPSHGAVGTTVTISGQGFSTTKADDTIKFNGTAAIVTKATTTTLTTSVPAGATTGTITVTVGSNTATSADIFTVDNTGLPPVITSFSPAIGVIGTAITVVGKNLDSVNNQTTAGINSWKTGPTSATETQVVFPVTTNMGSGQVFVTTPYGMGVSSGYFYVLPPNTCGNSVANVTIKKVIEAGQSTGAMTIPAGQCAAVLFKATAGSYLSFQASGISGSTAYTVYDNHNHLITSGTLSTSNASIHLPAIPATGAYSIWLSSGSAAANLTLAQQADQALPLNKALTTSTTGAGQSQRLFFNASLNQLLGLNLTSQTTSPPGAYVTYAVYAPNGSQVTSFDPTGPTFTNLPYLPTTGTYTLIVTPTEPATTTSQLELVSAVAGNLTVNGASPNFANKWAGQNVYLTFSLSKTESVGLGITNVAVTSPNGYNWVDVDVYDASNSQKTSGMCYTGSSGGCGLDMPNLPAGTYQVVVSPPDDVSTMSFTATVSQDAAGTLPTNTQETVNLTHPGQTGSYTFSGTANETVALVFGAAAATPTSDVIYTILNPDGSEYTGSEFASYYGGGAAFTWNAPKLPQTGTYTLYIDPENGATITQTAELVPGVTGTMVVNGPSLNLATTVPGEFVYAYFDLTTSESVDVNFSNVNAAPAGDSLSVYVYDAEGDYKGGRSCYVGGGTCTVSLSSLPVGEYQVVVEPYESSGTVSFTVALTSP